MNTPDDLKSDLQYLISAVDRQSVGILPASVALLWCAVSLVGFTLLDLHHQAGAIFFMAAPPVAFLLSLWLGARSAMAAGVRDRLTDRLNLLHWGSFVPSVAALVLIALQRGIPGPVLGQLILVVIGLIYFLGGVHLRIRPLVAVGLLAMLAAVAIGHIERWGWTGTGIIVAIGLLASARWRSSNA